MAARDNQQTLQIIIVSLILALVVTGIAAVFFGIKWSNVAQDAETAKNQLDDGRGELNRRLGEIEQLKEMLGGDGKADAAKLAENFKEDMDKYGANFDQQQGRNYRNIIQHVFAEIQQVVNNENQAKSALSELEKKFIALDKKYEGYQANFTTTLADIDRKADERVKAKIAELEKADTRRQQELDKVAQQNKQLGTTVSTLEGQVATLQNDVLDKTKIIEQLQLGVQKDHTVFERPDGKIVRANQASRRVYINIGRGDSLREQIRFSVYDANDAVAGENEPKAKIEVTRVFDDKLAEAAIVEDDLLNPIVPGDNIYSPVWERGKQVRFALTGFIDLDGDLQDDTERMKRIIEASDGIVDAFVDNQGDVSGEMSVTTRFLVDGGEPTKGIDPVLLRKQSNARQQMLKEAVTKDVDQISIDKFLSFVGWKQDERTVRLGSGARAEDFAPKPNDTGTTGAFRKRFPRSPY